MYRRLISGMLACTMAVQLCAGTVQAAEKPGHVVQQMQSESHKESESASEDVEKAESQEEAEDAAKSEMNKTSEDAADAETESILEQQSVSEAESKTEGASEASEPQSEAESTATTECSSETEGSGEIQNPSETEDAEKTETDTMTESITESESETNTAEESDVESESDSQMESETGTDAALEPETALEAADGEKEIEEYEEGNPDFLYQAGGFQVMDLDLEARSRQSDDDSITLLSEGDMDQLAAEIYAGLKDRKNSIDVRAYEFNNEKEEDKEQLLMVYYAVVNDHPELYYVRTGYTKYILDTKIISRISPNYYENIDNDAFSSGVQRAKAAVTADMDDLQIAIALHDYIVLNCEYDKERLGNGTIPKESYGAYGVLVERIAVCQGYALAYKYLLNEFGIDSYIVTSDKMNGISWRLTGHYIRLIRLGMTRPGISQGRFVMLTCFSQMQSFRSPTPGTAAIMTGM